MKQEIKNRWTGEIQFTAEIDATEETPISIRIGLAVKWAIKNNTNLTHANLTHADLTHANLTHADLTRADLTRADLTHADLTCANLTHANLTGADLTGAWFNFWLDWKIVKA